MSSSVTALYRDARIPPTDLQGETNADLQCSQLKFINKTSRQGYILVILTCVLSVTSFRVLTLHPETSFPRRHLHLSSPLGKARSCGFDRSCLQDTWTHQRTNELLKFVLHFSQFPLLQHKFTLPELYEQEKFNYSCFHHKSVLLFWRDNHQRHFGILRTILKGWKGQIFWWKLQNFSGLKKT